jgi:hypothetical protein
MSCPLPPNSPNPADSAPEEILQENPAGAVLHQDQFNTPQEDVDSPHRHSDGGNRGGPRQRPTDPPNKRKLRTVFASSVDSIMPGLHGGVVIHLTTIFGKQIELLVHGIYSITYAAEIVERELTQVSLRQMAKELFQTPMSAADWDKHLRDVAVPAVREMSSNWIGRLTGYSINPVDQFFFGPGGLLNDSLDQELLRQRITSFLGDDTIVPLMTEYRGPGMVVVYPA